MECSNTHPQLNIRESMGSCPSRVNYRQNDRRRCDQRFAQPEDGSHDNGDPLCINGMSFQRHTKKEEKPPPKRIPGTAKKLGVAALGLVVWVIFLASWHRIDTKLGASSADSRTNRLESIMHRKVSLDVEEQFFSRYGQWY